MKEDKFLQFLGKSQQRLVDLTISKGREYKGAGDDQFGNFHRLSNDTGLTREQVLLVYLTKHLDSIRTYVRDRATGVSRTRSESIGGRIEDAILYLTLLGAMVEENEDNSSLAQDNSGQLVERDNLNQLGTGTIPPIFKTLDEIRNPQERVTKAKNSAELLWGLERVYIAYDSTSVDMDAVRKTKAYIENEAGVKVHGTFNHPDQLHGCNNKIGVVWVGSDLSIRFKEFEDKCQPREVVFIPDWVLFAVDAN